MPANIDGAEKLVKEREPMLAIVRTGGKQYRVAPGDVIRVERLPAECGTTVELQEVLLVQDGHQTRIGRPTLDGACVRAQVVTHGRGRKVYIRKFKRRKNYRRFTGHRQGYTELRVAEIVL